MDEQLAQELASKTSTAKRPTTRSQAQDEAKKREEEEEQAEVEEEEQGSEDEADDQMDTGEDGAASGSDQLASIDGIKPNVLLADGDEKEVQSQTRFVQNHLYSLRSLKFGLVILRTK